MVEKKRFNFYSPDDGIGGNNISTNEEYTAPESGLDMKKTIEWYEANKEELVRRLPDTINTGKLVHPLENREYIELTDEEVASVLDLFPEVVRRRSIVNYIVGQPQTWFKQGEGQVATTNKDEAISKTAIIPSYFDPSKWTKDNPAADVWLYAISDEACSPEVKKIILSEGLAHEFAHGLIATALYTEQKLKLPSGEKVDAFMYIMDNFANAVEDKHTPISHYSSFFEDKFKSDNPQEVKTAVNEELAESIAAYLLNFVYCDDPDRRMDPFRDRPEVKKLVDDFLNAELI